MTIRQNRGFVKQVNWTIIQ